MKNDFSPSVLEQKSELRSLVLSKLAAVSVSRKTECSRSVLEALKPFFQNRLAALKSSGVALFESFPDEIDTKILIKYLKAQKIPIFVPKHSVSHKTMHFEILGQNTPVDAALPGVYLVPGLAFSKTGERLGRGAGFYDRFLAEYKVLSIGLCFDEQVVSRVPLEKHDQKVDTICTPSFGLL